MVLNELRNSKVRGRVTGNAKHPALGNNYTLARLQRGNKSFYIPASEQREKIILFRIHTFLHDIVVYGAKPLLQQK
jgi:hypothetical protein